MIDQDVISETMTADPRDSRVMGVLDSVLDRLPQTGPLALTPARRTLIMQFMRFGVVGVLGFLCDATTVYAMRHVIGQAGALILAYFVAASMNFVINRLWTFRGVGAGDNLLRQWGIFLAANSLGFLLNRGTALTLTYTVPFINQHVVLALVAGTLAGMFSNFTLSRRLVFR
ncbi:GtrA family protein [Lichenicoccus roseus]|nr:GtrA family protein [Lichenicoccus roseus]